MTSPPISAKQVEISGVVQGVGFRPFLFGLAKTHHLCGRVSNTAKGVDLFIEGPIAALETCIRDIRLKAPLLSRISDLVSTDQEVRGYSEFKIIKSRASTHRSTLISPDVSICPDCLAEMLNPSDRRFEYPFINCTNCGPRYTIINDIPYDRPKTSMNAFVMCPRCQAEYDNPLDRRFHAQPNACPVCGPQVFLTDHTGRRQDNDPGHALDLAAKLLGQGKILAVKGLGGFHLAADASDEAAVARLRKRKNRPDKPFALMAASESSLFDHVDLDDDQKALMSSFHRPIVLLNKKNLEKTEDAQGSGLASSLAPGNSCLGVMLPYTPLHYLLLDKGPDILVMTSGNRSGEPLSIDNEDALDAFSHIADYFLFHNRDIYFRADDSIARVQKGKPRFIRRSRGYAPLPLDLTPVSGKRLPKILGCGGGLKSAVCLTRDCYGFLSQHIGDLENPKVHDFFTQTIDHMEKILNIEPEAVAHDLHSGYYSTGFAKSLGEKGFPLIPVQHHHAHALSCMAENRLEGKVVAITLDGTGFGTDGHIWGGEILTCTYRDFKRCAHLYYLPMPGGDAAVFEPWRMAASLLYKSLGRAAFDLDIPYVKAMADKQLGFILQMIDKGVNCPLTSSAGRLFDAVSSLLCISHTISYESQAAMALEFWALRNQDPVGLYSFKIHTQEDRCRVMDFGPGVEEIIQDIQNGVTTELISAKFHHTLVFMFTDEAEKIARESGIDRVVLSGGVFNNDRLLSLTIERLEAKGLSVFTQSLVPCGDGGIALGQVMAAAAQMAAGADQETIKKSGTRIIS
ncbi:MAG: carbamoyltransferase HypF [Desulfobacter sp.]|nr:carbamoyltransferase HypF [Desulfobacter sp.]